jgi:hypothetical protein
MVIATIAMNKVALVFDCFTASPLDLQDSTRGVQIQIKVWQSEKLDSRGERQIRTNPGRFPREKLVRNK